MTNICISHLPPCEARIIPSHTLLHIFKVEYSTLENMLWPIYHAMWKAASSQWILKQEKSQQPIQAASASSPPVWVTSCHRLCSTGGVHSRQLCCVHGFYQVLIRKSQHRCLGFWHRVKPFRAQNWTSFLKIAPGSRLGPGTDETWL